MAKSKLASGKNFSAFAELEHLAYTVTPSTNTTAGGANCIPRGTRAVVCAAVTNDANDWVILPSLADVEVGNEILIYAPTGGNCELRTPASSNEKINDVDSDGTQEYLMTATDTIRIWKISSTAWVAQSMTKLGAVRTAVIPD